MILEHKQYDLYGKMLFEKVIITPPFKKFNSMPNEACFLYIIEGEVKHFSAIGEVKAPAKESILFKCGNYLSQMFAAPPSKQYMALAVHFHPEVLKKIYDKELPKFLREAKLDAGNNGTVKINSDELLQKYIDGMLFYFENPALVNEEILVLKFKELVLLLNQTKDAPAIQQILSTLFSPMVYSFKEIVDAHIFSNITIQELSQLTNLSLSSFKREFNKIYDESPASYIKNKKLERAKELLLVSELRIGDIAYDCGFEDIAHFSRSFKKKYSIPPTNFRLSQKDKSLS